MAPDDQFLHRCKLCGVPLDRPDDPLSADCDGDCWGCVGLIEAEMESTLSHDFVGREIDAGLRDADGVPIRKSAE
jgi:hypothetical protein